MPIQMETVEDWYEAYLQYQEQVKLIWIQLDHKYVKVACDICLDT